MITISLCMIVKDEEKVLARCLDSIKSIMDEIVIVDTGSSDRTKKIAAKYTDKIYDFEWDDDFAAARNFAFSKCTCDYIYSADADEVIDEENLMAFAHLKEAMLPEVEIVQMWYTNQLMYNTTYNYDEELRPKLYKRLRTFVWEDPLHESVRLNPVIFDSDIKIKHLPTSEHQDRDFAIFQKIIERDKGLSKKLKKMYARELFVAGTDEDFIEAGKYFSAGLDSDQDPELIMIDSAVVAKAARLLDSTELMMRAVSRALASDDTPSEVAFELGEYYRTKRDYKEAVMWYYNAAFETEALLNGKYRDSLPFIGLHICFVIMGDRENAAKYAALAKEREA
ncbi:MAG: glycosyltransferase family 2 protein [Lachnospiraceae bacterium]|nr:glycosyltransferase family 2 protein [Lachnospiraceae bacterium]